MTRRRERCRCCYVALAELQQDLVAGECAQRWWQRGGRRLTRRRSCDGRRDDSIDGGRLQRVPIFRKVIIVFFIVAELHIQK